MKAYLEAQAPSLADIPHPRNACEFIGYVEAEDKEQQAIKEAIKQFEISDPEKQERLVAQRVT